MKRRITQFFSVAVCLGILFCLSGCKLEHYTRKEAIDWFREEVADVPVKVSKEYVERPTGESSYEDRIWTACLPILPELEFELISHETWGMETITHTMQTTFHSVWGRYYFSGYPEEGKSLLTEKQEEPTSYFCLDGVYHNRVEIQETIRQAQEFTKYIQEQEIPCIVSFSFCYDDPLQAVDKSSDTRITVNTREGLRSGLLEEVDRLFALYAADYRIAEDQFTREELAAAVSYYDSGFVLYRENGSSVVYPDMSLSRFGYGLSFGGLYEILKREGFAVEGNSQAFQFTGIDGSQYSFSYFYRDEPFLHADEIVDEYYYLKDGERVPMDYYFYNHIGSGLLQEMTGLSFVDGADDANQESPDIPHEMVVS